MKLRIHHHLKTLAHRFSLGLIPLILFAAFLCFNVLSSQSAQAEEHPKIYRWDGVDRIVAMGDLHGGYDKFVSLMRSAGLINRRNQWSGGSTHYVQTGDIPDRGPDTRKIIDLLRELEVEARAAGGMVHALIGNHEAMNVEGDLRYVHAGEYEAFKTRNSRRVQSRFYQQHVETLKASLPEDNRPQFNSDYKREWEEKYPQGYVEHRLAWQAGGEYGNWVAAHNAIVIINDIMFLHGGMSEPYSDISIFDINAHIRAELNGSNSDGLSYANDPDGPLWYRGLALKPEDDPEEIALIEKVQERHDINHIVIGHSTTPGAVLTRFDGSIVQIDVGLGPAYGSHDAYLLVENETLYSVHRGQRLALPLSSQTEAQITYLQQAAAIDPQPSPLAKLIESLRIEKVEAAESQLP